MLGQGLAACAGLCAAMASVCAKLAMAGEETLRLCNSLFHQEDQNNQNDNTIFQCSNIVLFIRVAFFGVTFIFNALMWTLFVKALQKCPSTIQATLTNTGANVFFSALLGRAIFGETLPLLWWLGASLVLTGLVLIHRGSPDDSTTEQEDKKQS